MPFRCCVISCKDNYPTGPTVQVSRFPRGEDLLDKWKTAIPRDDLQVKSFKRVDTEAHCKMPSVQTALINMDGYEKLGCLHEMFVRQAKATPNSVAVITHDNKRVTFKELDFASDVLATKLRHLGVKRNTTVGILMDRCLEYVISYIGILKAGGAYMPLEVSYPLALLQSVLEDSEPMAVCTKLPFKDRLSGITDDERILTLEGDWLQSYSKLPPIKEPVKVCLDDMAYTVYSSGTTGKPKGIQCPHRGAVYSYHWRHLSYPYLPDDREACNVFFVWELLRPLLKGIPLYIIPDDVIYDPPQLVAFLEKHSITRMLFTPSLLQAVIDFKGLNLDNGFKTMRQIWFCGEVVTTILRDRVAKRLPWVKLLNLYSISECHDLASGDLTNILPSQEVRKFCPVGKLLPGVHVVIMDDEMNVKPVGMPGEIYVGGPTLALGYLNRPDLTAQRFISRPPHIPSNVGSRLYRTGDWGYVLSEGTLEICGRCDSMVKIRGYSIEIQAVEAALLQLPMVNTGCVLVQGEEGSDKFLVAYIVAKGKTSRKEVRAGLKKLLPFYMIPSKFVFLDSIPILESSGKLDKKALPKIDMNEKNGIDPQDLPSTATEHIISDIWCRVLQLQAIDIQENFFDLGGHSLLAARLLNEMNTQLGLSLVINDLFQHPSISTMATYIDDPKRTTNGEIKLDLHTEVERHDQSKTIMDIRLRAFWRSFQLSNSKSRRDNILVTGVTGFVGAFILKELLLSTKATVYCLVRETPEFTPLERIKQALHKYGILGSGSDSGTIEERLEYRIVPIKGDITLLNLGMKEDDYMYLSFEVDSIIHAAAMVNLIYPYRALHSTNVLGTENIIKFALEHKIKPIHHISTDAVFPEGLHDCSEDADMAVYADDLKSGYSQSKWVAEKLVLRAKSRGLPVAIYRCGNVAGSEQDPCWNELDFTLLMLQGVIATLTAPDVNWQIELTPVDFVSKVIVGMTQDIKNSIGKTFHLINTSTMDSHDLWQLLRVQGYPVEVVPFSMFYKKIRSSASNSNEDNRHLLSLLYILDTLVRDETFFSNISTFTRDNLQSVLSSQGISYPPVDAQLMRKYLRYLPRLGLISRPKRIRREGPQLLSGKVALITGASSGIGAAIAEHLASAGAKVALAARRVDKLKQLQTTIENEGGVAISVEMDVCNETQVKNGVKYIESLLGPVNILVNNAGVMYYTLMKNVHLSEWKHMVDVNVNGVLNCVAAVLPGMVERKNGRIVNISSDAGRRVFPGLAVYTGTKYFIEGMSRALRQEVVGSGVMVTCIQPGDVKTELFNYSSDLEAKEIYSTSPDIKVLEPADIAQAILYALTQPNYCAVNEILIEPREYPI